MDGDFSLRSEYRGYQCRKGSKRDGKAVSFTPLQSIKSLVISNHREKSAFACRQVCQFFFEDWQRIQIGEDILKVSL